MFKQGFESSKILFVATSQIRKEQFFIHVKQDFLQLHKRISLLLLRLNNDCRDCSIERRKETKCSIGFERKDTSFRKNGLGFFWVQTWRKRTPFPISSVFLTENVTSFLRAKRSGIALEEEWRPSNKVWLCLPGANGRRIDHRLPRNPTHYCGSFTFYTSTRERTQRGRESRFSKTIFCIKISLRIFVVARNLHRLRYYILIIIIIRVSQKKKKKKRAIFPSFEFK